MTDPAEDLVGAIGDLGGGPGDGVEVEPEVVLSGDEADRACDVAQPPAEIVRRPPDEVGRGDHRVLAPVHRRDSLRLLGRDGTADGRKGAEERAITAARRGGVLQPAFEPADRELDVVRIRRHRHRTGDVRLRGRGQVERELAADGAADDERAGYLEPVEQLDEPAPVVAQIADRAAEGILRAPMAGKVRDDHPVARAGQLTQDVAPLDAALARGVDAQHGRAGAGGLDEPDDAADLDVLRCDHAASPATERIASHTRTTARVRRRYA